jgi:hypothetical protein
MPFRSVLCLSAAVLLAPGAAWCGPDPVSERAEHAPLALFSLGSLAVGGAFYAIHVSTRRPDSQLSADDRTSLTNAIGAAGITALLAAGSYFWFTRDGGDRAYSEKLPGYEPAKEPAKEPGKKPERDWDARVSGGVAPDGEMSVGAMVTLPLSFLAP